MEAREEPFALLFGMKSAQEVVIDGILGIKTVGMASLYDVEDLSGEHQAPGAFRDVVDTWGRQARPLVDFEHGLDPVLGTAGIGWGLTYALTPEGLYAECFLPKEPTPPFRENAAAKNARWAAVYQDILAGKIRGYSVQGVYQRAGKALKRWSMNILTITGRPCLPQAQFALGSKAVKAMMDTSTLAAPVYDAPMAAPRDQASMGTLSRPAFGRVMREAQAHGDKELHDHLTARPAHLQGPHDPESCSICTDRRTMMGLKMAPWALGAKAVMKTVDGEEFPAADFLVVEDPAKPDGWHLQVKEHGTPNHTLMGAAYAALTSNHRGRPYAGPDKMAAMAKLRKLYAAEDMDWPGGVGDGKKALIVAQARDVIAAHTAAIDELLAGAKAGRRLSKASRDKLQHHVDSLDALKQDLAAFLDEEGSEPAATDADEAEGEKAY